jgi:type IV secretion system protein VirB9
VSLGFPLDIVFDQGEQVHNVTDGDRAPQGEGQARRWEVRQGVEGLGDMQRHHVFVTVTEAGLKNGLTITTTKRTVYVTLSSVARSPIRVLRWTHPEGEAERVPTTKPDMAGPLPDLAQPLRWHVGYEAASSRSPAPTWMPRYVIDDGRKTYLIYPEVTLFETAPLVRLTGPNGPQLVNARQYLNVTILDQLVARLELRVGLGEHAEVVTITRGNLRTIECPGDPACPVFPRAAAALARRTP